MQTPKAEPTVTAWKCKECGYLTLDVQVFVRHKRAHSNNRNRQIINPKDAQSKSEGTLEEDVNVKGSIESSNVTASVPDFVNRFTNCALPLSPKLVKAELVEEAKSLPRRSRSLHPDPVGKSVNVEGNQPDSTIEVLLPSAAQNVTVKIDVVESTQTEAQELKLVTDHHHGAVAGCKRTTVSPKDNDDKLLSCSPVLSNQLLVNSELELPTEAKKTPMPQVVTDQHPTFSVVPIVTPQLDTAYETQVQKGAEPPNRNEVLTTLTSKLNGVEVEVENADKTVPPIPEHASTSGEEQKDGQPPFESAQVKEKCPSCHQLVESSAMGRHRLRKHPDQKSYNCPECPFKSNASVDFWVHKRAHEKKFQHSCFDCFELFETPELLQVHFYRSHAKQYCSPPLKRKRKVVLAKKQDHDRQAVVAVPQPLAKKPSTSNIKFQCQFCLKLLPSRSGLEDHLNSHTRPFQCYLCQKRFSRDREMVKHKINYHSLGKEESRATSIKLELESNTSSLTFVNPLTIAKVNLKPTMKQTSLSSHKTNLVPEPDSPKRKTRSHDIMVVQHKIKAHGGAEKGAGVTSTQKVSQDESDLANFSLSKPLLVLESKPNVVEVDVGCSPRRESKMEAGTEDCGGKSSNDAAATVSTSICSTVHDIETVLVKSDGIKCIYCPKMLSRNQDVIRHERWHTKPYHCSRCAFRSGTPADLVIHTTRTHSLTRDQARAEVRIRNSGLSSGPEKYWYCNKCPFKTEAETCLKHHMRVVHLITEEHKCGRCSAAFAHLGHRNQHLMKIHGVSSKLQLASKLLQKSKEGQGQCYFIKLPKLETNSTSFVPIAKPRYHCQHCPFTTVYLRSYRSHQQFHRDRNQFKCAFCTASFSSPISRGRHQAEIHPKELKMQQKLQIAERERRLSDVFRCADCPFVTKWEHGYKLHRVCHDNQRPYRCPVCTASFDSSSSKYGHVKRVHGVFGKGNVGLKSTRMDNHDGQNLSKVKPVLIHCPDCDYRSTHRDLMGKHIRRFHRSRTEKTKVEQKELAAEVCSSSNGTLASADQCRQVLLSGVNEKDRDADKHPLLIQGINCEEEKDESNSSAGVSITQQNQNGLRITQVRFK